MPLPLILGGLASVLVSELPSIASWIFGDKTGKAVETVTGIARDVLGTDDPASIERAIAGNPELALQFKTAVLQAEASAREHEAEMGRQELDALKAEIADVSSAREQTSRLAEAGSAIAWGSPVVSVIITIAFAVMLYVSLTRILPGADSKFVDTLMGVLAAAQMQVVNYWLGSSRGSAMKDQALARVARG